MSGGNQGVTRNLNELLAVVGDSGQDDVASSPVKREPSVARVKGVFSISSSTIPNRLSFMT